MSVRRASILLAGCVTFGAHADGGAVVWMGERDGAVVAVLVAPAALHIGSCECAWIGPHGDAVTVTATHASGAVCFATCVPSVSTREVHATLELTQAGIWSFEVDPDARGPLLAARFDLEVGDAPAAWSAHWPFLFAWVPIVGIGVFAASRRVLTQRPSNAARFPSTNFM
ncbi:MAG: hypothetical protein DWH96_08120 [Planctomycetota bacterium]|nr:MAG: hypothetical protein DWH96_08120 [Planctomycetota bacterium]RLS91573.1 MAG: hypothetical protein DWI11_10835 [Planctomycetota bacterium]